MLTFADAFTQSYNQGLERRRQEEAAKTLYDIMRVNTDNANYSSLSNAGAIYTNALQPTLRQEAVTEGAKIAAANARAMNDPETYNNYLRSLGMTEEEIAGGKPSPMTDKEKQFIADSDSLAKNSYRKQTDLEKALFPAQVQYNAAKQMYSVNPYNDYADVAAKNPSVVPSLLSVLQHQDTDRRTQIQTQTNNQLANWYANAVKSAKTAEEAANAAFDAERFGVKVPSDYIKTKFPEGPASVSNGGWVRDPKAPGGYRQIGKRDFTGKTVQLANGNIGLIDPDGNIKDTGVAFYVSPRVGRGGGSGGGRGSGKINGITAAQYNQALGVIGKFREWKSKNDGASGMDYPYREKVWRAQEIIRLYGGGGDDGYPGEDAVGNGYNVEPSTVADYRRGEDANTQPSQGREWTAADYDRVFRQLKADNYNVIYSQIKAANPNATDEDVDRQIDSQIYAFLTKKFG